MISELPHYNSLEQEKCTLKPFFYIHSSEEIAVKQALTFEPQQHRIIKKDEDEAIVRVYGSMSSGMEYFIQREEEHEKRITEIEKTFREKVLSIRGYSAESLEPHYTILQENRGL